MHIPDSPDYNQPRFTPAIISKLNSQARNVLGSLWALLGRNGINDETDRKLVIEAMAVVENPSENLSDIMKHTTLIAQVMAGYMMQGEEAPQEIDALNGYLLALQCVNRMKFIEDEIEKGNTNSPEIKQAMVRAIEWARILSVDYYVDQTFLTAVTELKKQI